MLVSVLMSVYKEPSMYIRAAISSILNQTFTDFEFVIVGDSPESDRDRVFGIIEEYASHDCRIVFIPNVENIGLTKSLNIGLDFCKGKYIARMDADDISLPTRLEKQVQFMETNSQVLASSSWIQYIDESGQILDRIIKNKFDAKELRTEILSNSVLAHPASIYHRIINGVPVKYDESFLYAQDYALWVWILQYGELSNIQDVLIFYRTSKAQISSTHNLTQTECAKCVQRMAFKQLYDLPIIESFMDVFSEISLEGKSSKDDKVVVKQFRSFFERVTVTRKNYDALKLIVFTYVKFYIYKALPPQKAYKLIFDITVHNPKLLVMIECQYALSCIRR